jgi:hypothetical protein
MHTGFFSLERCTDPDRDATRLDERDDEAPPAPEARRPSRFSDGCLLDMVRGMLFAMESGRGLCVLQA